MTTIAETPASRLAMFPVTFFAVVMGLGGLALALHAAAAPLGLGPALSGIAFAVAAAVFVLISAIYLAKAARHPAAVAAEWHHPVKLAFFPAISISLLLLATSAQTHAPGLALPLWLAGAALHAVLTVTVVSGWIGTRAFQHGHLSPAWFIPAVGNVIVPIAGVPLGFVELSWYFMAVGLVFWSVLLTLVFNRLVFHDPLPGRLQPTLVILIAPPAVAYLAWMRLTTETGPFALILLNSAYFFALVVAVQLPRILRLPFAMSFWALSFPIAAIAIASFAHAGNTGSDAHRLIGAGLLAVLVIVIAGLSIRTLRAVARGEICQPD